MSNFCSDQGRTRVFGPRKAGQEGVRLYAAAGNPRRTPSRTKMAIYGWTLTKFVISNHLRVNPEVVQHLFNGINHQRRTAEIIFNFRRVFMCDKVIVMQTLVNVSGQPFPFILFFGLDNAT